MGVGGKYIDKLAHYEGENGKGEEAAQREELKTGEHS